jgi:hypothetical protein
MEDRHYIVLAILMVLTLMGLAIWVSPDRTKTIAIFVVVGLGGLIRLLATWK